jgi:hypothetical protein
MEEPENAKMMRRREMNIARQTENLHKKIRAGVFMQLFFLIYGKCKSHLINYIFATTDILQNTTNYKFENVNRKKLLDVFK